MYCVGSDLCDELITRPEESYRICVSRIMCDLENLTVRGPTPDLGCCTTGNVMQINTAENKKKMLCSYGKTLEVSAQNESEFCENDSA